MGLVLLNGRAGCLQLETGSSPTSPTLQVGLEAGSGTDTRGFHQCKPVLPILLSNMGQNCRPWFVALVGTELPNVKPPAQRQLLGVPCWEIL